MPDVNRIRYVTGEMPRRSGSRRIMRKLGLVSPDGGKVHQAIRCTSGDGTWRWWKPRCGAWLDPGRVTYFPRHRRKREWKSAPISGPEAITCQRCARMMAEYWPYRSTRISEEPVVWVATHGEEVQLQDA